MFFHFVVSSAGLTLPQKEIFGNIIFRAIRVQGLSSKVTFMSSGDNHTCVIMDTSSLKCWGGNWGGQIGDGTTTERLTSTDVSNLSVGAQSVSIGYDHTCAVLKTGGVTCWGQNNKNQIGKEFITPSLAPVNVDSLASGVTSLSLGAYYTCALIETGGVKCWGDNFYGTLGNGYNTSIPKSVLSP